MNNRFGERSNRVMEENTITPHLSEYINYLTKNREGTEFVILLGISKRWKISNGIDEEASRQSKVFFPQEMLPKPAKWLKGHRYSTLK